MDALRGHGRMQLSLVALEGTALVGHIAFSPVTITQPDGAVVDGSGSAGGGHRYRLLRCPHVWFRTGVTATQTNDASCQVTCEPRLVPTACPSVA